MRLFLLPVSTRRTLIYCEPLSSNIPKAEQKYLDRLVDKANTTWTGWEKSDTKWKLKTTEYGNKLFRRIAFEEWGLKSIPPLRNAKEGLQSGGPPAAGKTVQLRFPPAYMNLTGEGALACVKRLATERQSLHRTRMWGSIAAMPVAIPFGLIPVLPNLPFFYLLFRTYSHWKALQGAQHLVHLLEKQLLNPSPSAILDSLYTAGLLYPTRVEAQASSKMPGAEQTSEMVNLIKAQQRKSAAGNRAAADTTPKEEREGREEILLLQEWSGKYIAEKLQLPALQIEIERAVEQVENSLKIAQGKKAEEIQQIQEKDKGKA